VHVLRRALVVVRTSPIVAATLSFVVPGAGQAMAGRGARGLLFAAPLIALLVIGGLVLATQGTARTVGLALQPGVLLGFVAGNLFMATWRVAATVDAYWLARRRWPGADGRVAGWLSIGVLVVLFTVTLGTHAGLAYAGYETYDTVTTVFATPEPTPTSTPTPEPSAAPTPHRTPTFSPTPAPPPPPETWASDGRLDVLLMGLDEGPGRYSLRPDALILLSVDVATGRAALFGIPRYLENVPLPPRSVNAFACRCFPGYVNALFRYAEDNPVWFSGADRERGLLATEQAIGAMFGLDLDGRIVVNFRGFIRMIDALGGVTVSVPEPVYDPLYPRPDGTGTIELSFAPGVQWMDGFRALAYARTRHQDSDYHRLWRQEAVILSMRAQMNPCNLISRLPALLEAVGDTVSISLPIEELPNLMNLAARVQPGAIARYQLAAPAIPRVLDAAALDRIRIMARDPFPAPPVQTPGATPVPTTAPVPPPAPVC
jgi:LCP family protein required for cell wall assembly